ncbi:MAG: pirin family protein [Chloroflexota bacterium]
MATTTVKPRAVVAVAAARTVMEGAGVPIRRVLPSPGAPYEQVDPFVLLDEGRLRFEKGMPNFPVHSHRGFEIVTYALRGPIGQVMHAEGRQEPAAVTEGGVLRITAGRGMAHGEGAGEGELWEGEELHILQLWINLARAEKGLEPSVQTAGPTELTVEEREGARVKVLVGEGSPVRLRTPALYLDVTVPAGGQPVLSVPEGWQGFAYLLEGGGTFGSNASTAEAGQLVLLGPGDSFGATAGPKGARFVLAAGRPHGEEPIWNRGAID